MKRVNASEQFEARTELEVSVQSHVFDFTLVLFITGTYTTKERKKEENNHELKV